MICPKCGSETYSVFCPACGTDSKIFGKMHHISDILYNKGLGQAKSNDLTGAVQSLTKSIYFNKNNYQARNVLGLVYNECGRLGDALKQWIISSNNNIKENEARKYIKQFGNNPSVIEKINESIKLYNQSFKYLKQNSEDLAIIQLKKAIDANESFVDALNLLTLCYIIQKDTKKANQLIEKVLSIDISNPLALNYHRELNPSQIRPLHAAAKPAATKAENRNTPPSAYSRIALGDRKTFGRESHVPLILTFILGTICSFVIIYIILMPSAINAKDKVIADLTAEYSQNEQALNNTVAKQKNELNELTTENGKLKEENKALITQTELQDKVQKVLSAAALSESGKKEEALEALTGFDVSGLPSDILELYTTLTSTLKPALEQQHYSQGVADYNRRNYDDARQSFEKSIRFTTSESTIIDDTYYYLGRIAELNNDNVAAKKYYETIINDYPESNQFSTVQRRLRNLK